MALTGARSVCLRVASVPFFGGGGLLGRSCGMRQSRPGCCARSWCAARRAWLAVAPSNAMRAACGELAAPMLIVPIKMYINPLFGRAMIPRLWRMGGRQRLHSKSGCLQLCFPRALQGSSGRLQETLRGFFPDACASKVSRGLSPPSAPIEVPPLLRATACLAASVKGSRQVVVSLANRSLRNLQRKGVEHSFWAEKALTATRSTARQKHKFAL